MGCGLMSGASEVKVGVSPPKKWSGRGLLGANFEAVPDPAEFRWRDPSQSIAAVQAAQRKVELSMVLFVPASRDGYLYVEFDSGENKEAFARCLANAKRELLLQKMSLLKFHSRRSWRQIAMQKEKEEFEM